MSKLLESQKDIVKSIIIDKLGVDEVNDDSRLKDDLGADSLDEVELVMYIETEFGIQIPDEEAEEIKVVSDYYELIATRI